MKPLDPRLLRHARAARAYVFSSAGLGVATAALIVGQAALVAHVVGAAVQGRSRSAEVLVQLLLLGAVYALRSGVAGAQERYGRRSSRRVIAQLRASLLQRTAELGSRWRGAGHGAETVTLATRGLEALGPYFESYLPQLLLACTVTPATLALMLYLDVPSGLLVALTLPLVPVFMILVGRFTQRETALQLESMQRLGAQVLDLIAGLPTLRAHGREKGPAAQVRALGEAHRKVTLKTLRRAFLSSLVLELLTTLSVASVAVGVGIRLVHGTMDLTTGLFVLMLAPEVYLPLRQVGALFHASADGVAAAEKVLSVLETPVPARGTRPAPLLAEVSIQVRGVSVRASDRQVAAPANLHFRIDLQKPRVTALVGESGVGKSTAVSVLLGLLRPELGSVTLHSPDAEGAGVDLFELEPTGFWAQIAWLPQRPTLGPGTVLENVMQGREVSGAKLASAAAASGLDAVVETLPDGWKTRIGQGGFGLSLGQRQRLALTRVLVGNERLVILDEPTAHLDARGEQTVLAALAALPAAGRSVLIVTHRVSALALAEEIVEVRSAPWGAPSGLPLREAA